MRSFIDQTNRLVQISFPPKRIISLVPSQTELLFSLGLSEEVIGITKFCVHPIEWFRNKTRVGGTKTVNIEVIKALKPDLIIANKEENVKDQIEDLQQIAPVWISDIHTLSEALTMIRSLGEVVDKMDEAEKLVSKINIEFQQMQVVNPPVKTAYLIWKDPFMAVGNHTFIDDLLTLCGFQNVFASLPRYPEISMDQLVQSECKLLLLSSEPYPFQEKHIVEFRQYLPEAKIALTNGEMWSWYGSRLQFAPKYFTTLIEQVNSSKPKGLI